MSYELSQSQIDTIAAYRDNGEYSQAYLYVAGLIETPVALGSVSKGTQFWFLKAHEINSSDRRLR